MRRRFINILLLLSLLCVVACQDNGASSPTEAIVAESGATAPSNSTPPSPTTTTIPPTPTVIPPSPTPEEPLAASVNGDPIFLVDYEKELSRYERAQAELVLSGFEANNTDYRATVLDALIERVLIAQAAEAQGITISPQMVEEKLAELRNTAGDSGNFDAWLEANQWTLEEFREALAAEMLAEQLVNVVTADVPEAVEQVRARYLQVDDRDLAQSLLTRIRAGEEFATLAEEHSLDRVTGEFGGDLGFFARGSLLVPAVETAAFALAPGEVSDIISELTSDGNQATYFLVQVIERDPQRPLTADLRYALLQQAFESWLDAQWEKATIIRYVDTGT